MTDFHQSALVLFSGGQDSTTCLAHALARYERVETLAFDYRQRHVVELQARLNVLQALRAQQARAPGWDRWLPATDDITELGTQAAPYLRAALEQERDPALVGRFCLSSVS